VSYAGQPLEEIEARLEQLGNYEPLLRAALETAEIMKFSTQRKWAFVALLMTEQSMQLTERLTECMLKAPPPVYLIPSSVADAMIAERETKP